MAEDEVLTTECDRRHHARRSIRDRCGSTMRGLANLCREPARPDAVQGLAGSWLVEGDSGRQALVGEQGRA